MDDDFLLRAIERQNSWWREGSVPPALDYRVLRTAGLAAFRHLTGDSPRAILLLGPRQVGKTTALLQVVQRLLKSAPRHAICYLRLDDPDLMDQSLGHLVYLYRQKFWSTDRLAYLLLDEVHACSGWDRQLKSWVDGNEANRVLATGSLAPELLLGSRESGPGRWDELIMPPLSLFEYALLRGRAGDEGVGSLLEGWWERPPAPVPPAAQDIWANYLLQGGFPASALDNDLNSAQQRLREDIYERVLIRDMALHFGLRSFDTLRHLFRYVAENSSSIANLAVLATRIGTPSSTVADMLVRLQETLLVAQTLPYAHGKALLRPRPKLYLCDASLRSAVLLNGPEVFKDPVALGHIWETAAYNHLACFVRSKGGELSYWRDARGEVDFVLTLPGRLPLPIEVTAGTDFRHRLVNLARCMAKVGAKKAVLLGSGQGSLHDTAPGNTVRWSLPQFVWNLGVWERLQAGGGIRRA